MTPPPIPQPSSDSASVEAVWGEGWPKTARFYEDERGKPLRDVACDVVPLELAQQLRERAEEAEAEIGRVTRASADAVLGEQIECAQRLQAAEWHRAEAAESKLAAANARAERAERWAEAASEELRFAREDGAKRSADYRAANARADAAEARVERYREIIRRAEEKLYGEDGAGKNSEPIAVANFLHAALADTALSSDQPEQGQGEAEKELESKTAKAEDEALAEARVLKALDQWTRIDLNISEGDWLAGFDAARSDVRRFLDGSRAVDTALREADPPTPAEGEGPEPLTQSPSSPVKEERGKDG